MLGILIFVLWQTQQIQHYFYTARRFSQIDDSLVKLFHARLIIWINDYTADWFKNLCLVTKLFDDLLIWDYTLVKIYNNVNTMR
jgi:hypothetical protein